LIGEEYADARNGRISALRVSAAPREPWRAGAPRTTSDHCAEMTSVAFPRSRTPGQSLSFSAYVRLFLTSSRAYAMGMPAHQTVWTAEMVRALPDDGKR